VTFAAEAFKNLDEALGIVRDQLEAGNVSVAIQGIAMLQGRPPNLLAGIEAERDRMLERREG
jgi:hypothetical protein